MWQDEDEPLVIPEDLPEFRHSKRRRRSSAEPASAPSVQLGEELDSVQAPEPAEKSTSGRQTLAQLRELVTAEEAGAAVSPSGAEAAFPRSTAEPGEIVSEATGARPVPDRQAVPRMSVPSVLTSQHGAQRGYRRSNGSSGSSRGRSDARTESSSQQIAERRNDVEPADRRWQSKGEIGSPSAPQRRKRSRWSRWGSDDSSPEPG